MKAFTYLEDYKRKFKAELFFTLLRQDHVIGH